MINLSLTSNENSFQIEKKGHVVLIMSVLIKSIIIVFSLVNFAVIAQTKDESKVVVSTLDSSEHLDYSVPVFSTLDALFAYTDQHLKKYPNRVLKAFSKYQSDHSSSQIANDFYFRLAEIYYSLNKVSALKVILGFLNKKVISEDESVKLNILQARYQSLVGNEHQAIQMLLQQYEKVDNNLFHHKAKLALELIRFYHNVAQPSKESLWQQKFEHLVEHEQDVALKLGVLDQYIIQLIDSEQYDEAMRHQNLAISIAEQAGLMMLLNQLKIQLVDILIEDRKFILAQEKLEESYRQSLRFRDSLGQFRTLNRLAMLFIETDDLIEAKRMIDASQRLTSRIYSEQELSYFYLVKVMLLAKQQKYDSAIQLAVNIDQDLLSRYFDDWPVTRSLWMNKAQHEINIQQDITRYLNEVKSEWRDRQRRTTRYYLSELEQLKHASEQQRNDFERRIQIQETQFYQQTKQLRGTIKMLSLLAIVIVLFSFVYWLRIKQKRQFSKIKSFKQLTEQFNLLKQEKVHFHVVAFDFDDFKKLNKQLGFENAEKLVESLAANMSNCLKYHPPCFQLAVDKFVLLVSNFTDKQIITLMQVLKVQLSLQLENVGKQKQGITASIAATKVLNQDDLHTAIERVEGHINKVKRLGGNQIQALTK